MKDTFTYCLPFTFTCFTFTYKITDSWSPMLLYQLRRQSVFTKENQWWKGKVNKDAFNVHCITMYMIPYLKNYTYDCNRLLLNNSILFSRHLDIPVMHCETVWPITLSNWNTSANGNDVICSSTWETLHKVTIYFRVLPCPTLSTNFSINKFPKKNTKQQHRLILCIIVLMYE